MMENETETETAGETGTAAALAALQNSVEAMSAQFAANLKRDGAEVGRRYGTTSIPPPLDRGELMRLDYKIQSTIAGAGMVAYGLISAAALIAGAIDRSTGNGGNQ
ncbi:hypothetical protein N9164_16880 [Draconibacterium sp.]|nr:hypothetical protein [Draconibacterium sp.]